FLLGAPAMAAGGARAMKKIKDVVIYRDERFHSAFPSIVRRRDGELIVAFRRAPDRRKTGAPGVTHTDPNSQLVLVRSKDGGSTWSSEPELIYAHPEGGSQDPCMIALRDGTLLCASYWWYQMPVVKDPKTAKQPFEFMGGYIVRSRDWGRTWQTPVLPPPTPGVERKDPFGRLLPSYNRGAMCQGKDGRIYWAVAHQNQWGCTSISLMISADGGTTWKYSCPIAEDQKITFNETSLYETAKGDLIAFVRTANFDDHTVVVRSTNGGKSFGKWEDAGWQGHPHHAVRMADGRVWLVYGYRHKLYGIRARILNAECTDIAQTQEIVLRDDGGSTDLGYPWAMVLPGGQILSVYYFNEDNGPRYIGGTLWG
ncbi:MAG TPA: sialidase family protein, partial [Bryobacteraceae bacterium]|nr:sialidase family protein [Bryobacteraceae bacterium]